MAVVMDSEKVEVQPRSILKNKENRITFGDIPPLTVDPAPEEEEQPNLRRKKEDAVRPWSRHSDLAMRYDPRCDKQGFSTLASLLVLRVLFIDIGTSLLDVISDFMQGGSLLLKPSTRDFGIVVLGANWIPGLVAAIHLMAFYREGFIISDQRTNKSQIKKLILMVFSCFLFYPVLPTVGYVFMLLNMNIEQKSQKMILLDNIAQTAHGIAGCIEAPIQLTLTMYLIFIGLLEMPQFYSSYGKDAFNNIFIQFNISVFSMVFSFINIMTCAMKINIFNVYIVQLRTLDDLKRYATLSAGYFPFFLHSVGYRIFSCVFIVMYLQSWSVIPFVMIFLSNIFIGYIFLKDLHFEAELKERHKSFIDKREMKKGLGFTRRMLSSPDEDAPVWLNSFLSLFVPSCYTIGALPDVLDRLNAEERKEVYKEQARFQKKVITYMVVFANSIILVTVGVISYLVNFSDSFGYAVSRFSYIDFNISVLFIICQAIISFLFITEIDVLQRLGMSDFSTKSKDLQTKNQNKTQANLKKDRNLFCKLLVSLLFSCLVLMPPIIAYGATLFFQMPNVYIINKSEFDNSITIEVTKSQLLNADISSLMIAKETFNCNVNNLNFKDVFKDKMVLLENACIEKYPELEKIDNYSSMEIFFDGIAGLILMTSKKTQSSALPWKFSIFRKVTTFPVLLVNFYDTDRVLNISKNSVIELNNVDLSDALSNSSSHLFSMNCTKLTSKSAVNIFDRADNNNFFLGCNGNTKTVTKVNVTCLDKGFDCPELSSFINRRTNNVVDNQFDSCNKKETTQPIKDPFPAITCNNIPDKPNGWPRVAFLGNEFNEFEFKCYNGNNQLYYPKYKCQDENPTKGHVWGNWIFENKCIERVTDGHRYRFARVSPQCVMMEVEVWDKRSNCQVDNPGDTSKCSDIINIQ